jgi:hypothetical protein
VLSGRNGTRNGTSGGHPSLRSLSGGRLSSIMRMSHNRDLIGGEVEAPLEQVHLDSPLEALIVTVQRAPSRDAAAPA